MIKESEIKKLGELARIGLSKDEIKTLQSDIGAILDYFEKLKEIDTKNVKEIFHPLEVLNQFREDKATPPTGENKILIEAAPRRKDGYVKVKKIFENEI